MTVVFCGSIKMSIFEIVKQVAAERTASLYIDDSEETYEEYVCRMDAYEAYCAEILAASITDEMMQDALYNDDEDDDDDDDMDDSDYYDDEDEDYDY